MIIMYIKSKFQNFSQFFPPGYSIGQKINTEKSLPFFIIATTFNETSIALDTPRK